MRALDLEPARAAPAGFVRRVERLRHDALVAARERARRGTPRLRRRRAVTMRGITIAAGARLARAPRSARAPGGRRGRRRRAAGSRRRTPRAAARRAVASTSSLRPKRRIVTWNGCGAPSGRERDRLAVEDQLARRQRPHRLDDLRHRGGDVVQVAGEDAHLVAGLVDLDARAVELPLERGGAERGERVARRRPPASRASAAPAAAAGSRTARARPRLRSAPPARPRASPPANIAARRTVGRGQLRRLRDRVEHHAFERALPQLADDQPREEVLLVGAARGRRARRAARARAAAEPLPLVRAQALERRVDFGERQRLAACRRRRRPRPGARRSRGRACPGASRPRGTRPRSRSRPARAGGAASASAATFARRPEVAATLLRGGDEVGEAGHCRA